MVTPVLHRKWAREYLARAESSGRRNQKRRYLRLAVNNTMHAHRLEAKRHAGVCANGQKGNGSARNWLTPKR